MQTDFAPVIRVAPGSENFTFWTKAQAKLYATKADFEVDEDYASRDDVLGLFKLVPVGNKWCWERA